MNNKTKRPAGLSRVALLATSLLLPLCASASPVDSTSYTFSGTLKEDRHCAFVNARARTVTFPDVSYVDQGGGKKTLTSQPPQKLLGTIVNCTGLAGSGVELAFTVPAGNLGMNPADTFQVLKAGNGTGIELLVDGRAQDFDKAISVTDPGNPPELTVKVVQMENDGASLAAGSLSATATLNLSIP
ncbi:fimbrial protein [Cedecea sp. NFIX57]|uniref:fimbrial protein n=1 Tax=Cedecea sp. NFIX57 TaxID=1566286 RepID=UPI000A0BFAB6|nr:fimbrial protein [Cedecea sp. NFIX57]SMG61779.1 Fimbrial protein [Cedecea sp. NFIX57]